MRWLARFSFVLLALASAHDVLAAPVGLQDFLLNVDGTSYSDTSVVPGLDSSGFDTATGLGTLTLTFDPGLAGTYSVDAFFDLQLGVPFYNEFGTVGGAPSAGVSWQIDVPGLGDGNRLGTVYDNVVASTLDNSNHVSGGLSNFLKDCGANGGGPPSGACNNDVAMALGFDFVLAAGEQAVITLNTTQTAPAGGFYLRQVNPGNGSADPAADSVFLTGALSISPSVPIPEPSSLLMFLLGLALLSVTIDRTVRSEPADRG